MKLTNLAIIFSIIAASLFTIINIRVNHLSAVVKKSIEYNKMVDSAVDDGVMNLVEVDSNREIHLNKDKAVEQFYTSLYVNFGVIGDSIKEKQLQTYIPIILITYMDGYYIYYTDTYESNGEILTCRRWTEKLPYSFKDDRFIYSFTLSEEVIIYDKETNAVKKGNYHDLSLNYPDTILADDSKFDLERRNAIIGSIEDSMRYYVNRYNHIANQFGITYRFFLPQIDQTDWYRTIDDISMLVIFQGYPYGTIGLDTYNRFSIGGARINKLSNYYVELDVNGKEYYHKSDCESVIITSRPYDTKEECALEGAYPCPNCNP